MDNDRLQEKIIDAKDGAGVVISNALHDQLSQLSPADWHQLSTLYPKSASNDSGFYITDDAANNVTIHNDLTKANQIATSSIEQLTKQDATNFAFVAGTIEATTVGSAVSGSVFAAATEYATAGTLVAAGAGAIVPAAIVGVGIIGIAGAVELAHNYIRRGDAQTDVNKFQTLSFQAR